MQRRAGARDADTTFESRGAGHESATWTRGRHVALEASFPGARWKGQVGCLCFLIDSLRPGYFISRRHHPSAFLVTPSVCPVPMATPSAGRGLVVSRAHLYREWNRQMTLSVKARDALDISQVHSDQNSETPSLPCATCSPTFPPCPWEIGEEFVPLFRQSSPVSHGQGGKAGSDRRLCHAACADLGSCESGRRRVQLSWQQRCYSLLRRAPSPVGQKRGKLHWLINGLRMNRKKDTGENKRLRSPRFWVSGYRTKWRIQSNFHSSSSRS